MRTYPILLLVVGLSLSACDDTSGPSTGTLVVSTSTEGDDPDQDGYLLTVDEVDSLGLDPTGTAEVNLAAGRHTLRLLGVAEHCSVAPGTSLDVDIAPRSTTPVAFEVSCPATGARVSVTTTGADIDPDGYRVVVDGSDREAILANGTTLIRLEPGSRTIGLTGLAPNCAVDGPGSRTVTIVAAEVVPVGFAVVCTATTPQVNITGNWQFSTTSTVPGMPPVTIAGSITQSGSAVSGAVHVEGSNCFDQLTTIDLTGTLAGSNISLTSTSVAGQVITLTGSVTNSALTGAYAISGGCANGDQGNVTGFKPAAVNGRWRVIFESRSEEQWPGLAIMTQGSASSEGSFGLTGTADVSLSCFSGTITSGSFPSPSFIMGTTVALEIDTDDGTLVFRGTANEAGTKIIGNHQVVGGTCDGEFGRACLGRDLGSSCFQ